MRIYFPTSVFLSLIVGLPFAAAKERSPPQKPTTMMSSVKFTSLRTGTLDLIQGVRKGREVTVFGTI